MVAFDKKNAPSRFLLESSLVRLVIFSFYLSSYNIKKSGPEHSMIKEVSLDGKETYFRD